MLEYISSVALFCITLTFTPGPNNIMLLSSGQRFGFFRSLPHFWGIAMGTGVLLVCIAVGASQLVQVPSVYFGLKYVGMSYILYLAYKIASTRVDIDGESAKKSRQRPMRFIEAFLFQWVNPKAWMMLSGAVFTFAAPDEGFLADFVIILIVQQITSLFSASSWILLGVVIMPFLRSPQRQRYFNYTMALLLVFTVAASLLEDF